MQSSSSSSSSPSPKLTGPKTQPQRPNLNTYWVIPTKLLAGEYPGTDSFPSTRTKLNHYLDVGITYFLDLTQEGEKQNYENILEEEAEKRGMNVKYNRIPIPDFGIPSHSTMTTILNTVENAMKEGYTVYVHCRGGIGRTGTTIGCFLVRNGNGGEEGLMEVNRLFRESGRSEESWLGSPETREQIEFVRGWNEEEEDL